VAEVKEPTVLEHLQELRRRLSWLAATLVIGGFVTYFWRGELIHLLQQPLHADLFYTSPTGSFEFVMQICFLGGFLLSLPMLVFHLLRFISPAFRENFTHRMVAMVVAASCALALAGAAFAYSISLPASLHFFNQVGTSNLKPLISIDRYFSFVVSYLATFAAVFQLPLLLVLFDRVRPLDPPKLGRGRKWVIAGSFAVALVLPSAPDPLSQVILALPIIALYEVSIWTVWLRRLVRRRVGRTPRAVMPVLGQNVIVPRPRPAVSRTIDLRQMPEPVVRTVPARYTLDLRTAAVPR
jgi:sec-independent protein translocase protein TatC